MPRLGLIACEVLERELARLICAEPNLRRVTVIEGLHSRRLLELLEEGGCRNVETVAHIGSFRPEPGEGLWVVVRVLELSLHKSRKLLSSTLQAVAREMALRVDALLLGYGSCGNSIDPQRLDLEVPIFQPKDGERQVDDCVALCLGGGECYYREQLQVPGTFFMTPGWAQHWRGMLSEVDGVAAGETLGRMFRHYRRILLVVTPVMTEQEMRACAEPFARMFGLRVEVRKGSMELLEQAWDGARRLLLGAKEPVR